MMWAVAIASVVCACGPSSAPAPRDPVAAPAPPVVDAAPLPDAPLDRDLPRLAEQATALYAEIAAAFAAAGEDCAQATAKLTELSAKYADAIAANAKVVHEGRTADLRTALAPHANRLDAAARAIMQSPTMSACAQDTAFTAAFGGLVGEPS